MVAGHQDDIAFFDFAPGLAFDAFPVFGAVVLGDPTKGVHPTDFATGGVALGHFDRVAGLDQLFVRRHFSPSAAVHDLLVSHGGQLGQVHHFVEDGTVFELINVVVTGGLTIDIQHLHTHFGHACRGDAQETARDDLAQLNFTVAAAEVPALAFVAAEAGFLASIGQGIECVCTQARFLHRVVIELFAVHAARDRAQINRATASHQIGTHHIGQHIGVDAVESQGQTNGHRGCGTRTRQGG